MLCYVGLVFIGGVERWLKGERGMENKDWRGRVGGGLVRKVWRRIRGRGDVGGAGGWREGGVRKRRGRGGEVGSGGLLVRVKKGRWCGG